MKGLVQNMDYTSGSYLYYFQSENYIKYFTPQKVTY